MFQRKVFRYFENGFSLVEVLVAVGISSIMMLGMASSMTHQVNGVRQINNKLHVNEAEKLLSSAVSNSEVCKYAFGGLTFNANLVSSANPASVNAITPIYSWYQSTPTVVTGPEIARVLQPISPNSPDLVVQSIQLQINGKPMPLPVTPATGGFTANLMVSFVPPSSGSIKPISIPVLVTANTTTPAASTITNCSTNSGVSGIGVGQTWQTLTASRAPLTSYVNDTGKPIVVSITATVSNNGASIIVDGMTVGYTDTWTLFGHVRTQLTAIVPPGSTYVMGSTGGTLLIWTELR
jgi:prepilin-type N-terminal cleavage/methylation domain-containing protein